MLEPRNTKGILRSVERVLKHGDMKHLTQDAYRYVMNMGGFIAHYNISGFQAHYQDVSTFLDDLKRSLPSEISMRQRDIGETPERGYSKPYNGYGYEYCKSALDIALGIQELVNRYGAIARASGDSMVETKFGNLRDIVLATSKRDISVKRALLRELDMI